MLRDVLLACVDRGHAPAVLLLILLMICVLRMPQERIAELALGVITGLKNFSLLGYALSVIFLFGWFAHVSRVRKKMQGELDRMALERNSAQEKLLNQKMESSER